MFYGLGHLAFDHPRFVAELRDKGVDVGSMGERELVARFGEFGIYPRRESLNFPFHPLARRTGAAIVEANEAGVIRCGIVPCMIDAGEVTRPVRRGSAEWDLAVAFLRDCLEKGGLETKVVDTDWVHGGYDVVEFR